VKHWSILIIFGKETRRKFVQFWPPHPKVVTTLPCEMQKSYFGHWRQWIRTGQCLRQLRKLMRPQNHWKFVASSLF